MGYSVRRSKARHTLPYAFFHSSQHRYVFTEDRNRLSNVVMNNMVHKLSIYGEAQTTPRPSTAVYLGVVVSL